MTSTGHSFMVLVKVSVLAPSAQAAVVVDRELRHDDHLRPGGFACRIHRFPKFVEIEEGFENHQVDAGANQSIGLFPEDGASFRER